MLAHIRRAATAGMGKKPPDICGFWACASCHSLFDGRRTVHGLSIGVLHTYAYDALLRTLAELHREGLI